MEEARCEEARQLEFVSLTAADCTSDVGVYLLSDLVLVTFLGRSATPVSRTVRTHRRAGLKPLPLSVLGLLLLFLITKKIPF